MVGDHVVEWLLGAVSALLGLLHLQQNKRIERIEREAETARARFDELRLLMAGMEKQLERLLSDQESEKDTRRRINREHSEALGGINERINQLNQCMAQMSERVSQLTERRATQRST